MKFFEDSGGVGTSDFPDNAHMLSCLFMVQSTETMCLRVLLCRLGLIYNWLFHPDVTA